MSRVYNKNYKTLLRDTNSVLKAYKEIVSINHEFAKNKSKIRKHELLEIMVTKIDFLLNLLGEKEKKFIEVDYNNTFEFYLDLINCITYFKEQAQYWFIGKRINNFQPSYCRIKTIAKLNYYLKKNTSYLSKEGILRFLKKNIENENNELRRLITLCLQ